MNDITNEKVIDQLTGNGIVHGVPVKVELAQEQRTSAPVGASWR